MDSNFIVELFAPFGPVTVRRVFGVRARFAKASGSGWCSPALPLS
jgi:hypothetical protein